MWMGPAGAAREMLAVMGGLRRGEQRATLRPRVPRLEARCDPVPCAQAGGRCARAATLCVLAAAQGRAGCSPNVRRVQASSSRHCCGTTTTGAASTRSKSPSRRPLWRTTRPPTRGCTLRSTLQTPAGPPAAAAAAAAAAVAAGSEDEAAGGGGPKLQLAPCRSPRQQPLHGAASAAAAASDSCTTASGGAWRAAGRAAQAMRSGASTRCGRA